MAEFCLDCWNKMNHTLLTQEDVILSEDLDLCEECAEIKAVIIRYRTQKEKSQARRRLRKKAKLTLINKQ